MPTTPQYLTEQEITTFIRDLDKNNDGDVSYLELEQKFDAAHHELVPKMYAHHRLHPDNDQGDEERHTFLRGLMGPYSNSDAIPVEKFTELVRGWNIATLEDTAAKKQHTDYMQTVSLPRKIRAYWSVEGPRIMFLFLVIGMQIAFGVWQGHKYGTTRPYRTAFGWGVVVAKTCAGALYPSLFFLLLSMSRHLNTLARKSKRLTRVVDFDLGQEFHIIISIVTLCLGTMHGIGHLTGSFVFGSRPGRQQYVAEVLGADKVPRPYHVYASSLPGITGILALSFFWILALLSTPWVRKRNYEAFQLGHLLMFPIIGLLMAHGTAQLLQFTMLPYWLALPTLIILAERLTRVFHGFRRVPARLDVLDEETVRITIQIPNKRFNHWPGPYRAGQYVLINVAEISRWQWHPFTISGCREKDNEFEVHIKTDGNWTTQLRNLETKSGEEGGEKGSGGLKFIGVDGPFGAPAQRFDQFDTTIIIGSGIGVTPFSGILVDLHAKSTNLDAPLSRSSSIPSSSVATVDWKKRVDFHWLVRDKNSFLWFSSLLNSVLTAARSRTDLDLRIHTHATQRRRNVATHVFRALLERHRTEKFPLSPLTGLLNETQFGRPDWETIMDEHYESMKGHMAARERPHLNSDGEEEDKKEKVGVFFCGAPGIGAELADRCHMMNVRAREEKINLRYYFMMEVFG